jgi:hypothetical protein
MRYILLVSGLLATCLITFTTPVMADESASINKRAAAVHAKVDGLKTYNAYLAIDLADIAKAEMDEHDKGAAEEFMNAAEWSANKAGGKK